jgi:hypothetical protein
MSKYIYFIITFIVGIVVKHFYDQFKNKTQKIQYTVNKVFFGKSAHDDILGEVKVLHDGVSVENLYLCTIKLENTTNKDFKNLQIIVWTDVNSEILSSYATKDSSINPFKLTKEYQDNCSSINKEDTNIPIVISTRRPYDIPILNRDDYATFTCLVSNNKGAVPDIYLDCEEAGLKLEAIYVLPRLLWGENIKHCAIYGMIICAILVIPTLYFISSKIIASIVVFILGCCCEIPGFLLLKSLKMIRKATR